MPVGIVTGHHGMVSYITRRGFMVHMKRNASAACAENNFLRIKKLAKKNRALMHRIKYSIAIG